MNKNQGGVIKALLSASFLLVLIISALFLYWNASAIYKEQTDNWQEIIGGYLITLSLVLVVGIITTPKTIKAMGKANYWKSFVFSFIPSAIVTLAFLFSIKAITKWTTGISVLEVIGYLPLYVIIIHGLVITQIEEIMNGVIYDGMKAKTSKRNTNIVSMIVFSAFHFAKTGGSWIAMLMYAPLRLWWNHLKENGYPYLNRTRLRRFFGATPATQQNNAGSHFGWNVFNLVQ